MLYVLRSERERDSNRDGGWGRWMDGQTDRQIDRQAENDQLKGYGCDLGSCYCGGRLTWGAVCLPNRLAVC